MELLIGLLGAMTLLAVRLATNHRRLRRRLGVLADALDAEPVEPSPLRAIHRLKAVAAGSAARATLLEQAVLQLDVGVLIIDRDGQRVLSNSVADSYVDRNATDAVAGLRLRDLIAEAVPTSDVIERDIDLLSPTSRRLRLRAVPLFAESARIGTAILVTDLTEQSRIQTIRRNFVANASHELKTPLGAMRLLAEALTTRIDDETRDRLSGRIQEEATRMTRLVDDILTLAFIEETSDVTGTVDLGDVLDGALQQVAVIAEMRDVGISTECTPTLVEGDERRLVSALANLIQNAITYTYAKSPEPSGKVEVRIYQSGGNAVIEVEDNGIGIPERHLPRIFERFYRVDRGRSRSRGGTGLGLSIVRHVVEKHGGTIAVESTPGVGSLFRINLPLAATASPTEAT